MAQNDLPIDGFYHFGLQVQNSETVRNQATIINKKLKELRKVASDQGIPVTMESTDSDTTQQFVTVPPKSDPNYQLKEAWEEAERECRSSSSLPPPAKKKKRWFKWND